MAETLETVRKADNKVHGAVDFNRNQAQNLIIHTMTAAERAAMTSPKEGTLVYESDTGELYLYTSGSGASGTYTPTLANVTNVAASTAYQCHYAQIGNFVVVGGRVDVDPTTTGDTELGISLPVASDFTSASANECGGSAAANAVQQSAAVAADITNNRAKMVWNATDTANRSWFFTFTYRVI